MVSVCPSEKAQKLYQTDLDLNWRNEIVEANANFKVAAAVREVPLDFFLGMHSSRWLIARLGENALRLAALGIINALTDKRKETLTLEFLRRRAVELSRPSVRQPLKAYLKAEFQVRNVAELEQRARQLRGNVLAHANVAVLRDPTASADIRVSRDELGKMLGTAKELVGVLSFDVGRSFEFPPGDDDYRMSHLVHDVIVRHSFVLRMPEEAQPLVFRATWNGWAPAERETFNEWRLKLNRKPIEVDGSTEL